jgi:dihydrofolate reductase
MRTLVYLIGMTLDGRIAGPADEIDFFPLAEDVLAHLAGDLADTLPTHVRKAMGVDPPVNRFDTVVMGRRTYQPALDAGITSPYEHLKQYVVSRNESTVQDADVTRVGDDPIGFVRNLKQQAGKDIWLAGGAHLAGSLRPEIDEFVVKHYPLIAGAGVPVLAGEFAPGPVRITASREFSDGTRIVSYVPA